jgi:hypothetical protein
MGAVVLTNFARADDCLSAPNSPAPKGSHWYYQTDPATQRKCWELRAAGQPTQLAAQTTSKATPAATAGGPMSISPGDNAQPDGRVQQSEEGSTAPSIPEAAASQADTSSQTSADKCLTAPNSPAPKGSHWYYQTDRATQQKCWYLRALAQPTQPAAQATSEAAPARPNAFEKSATASAVAPISTSPDHNAPPVKPQLAPLSSATTNELVQQSAQEGSTASIPQASPPQASTSSQTSVQATGLEPGSPAVTMLKKRRLFPSDGHAQSAQSMADVRAPDNAESTARGSASTTKVIGIMASTTTPVAMVFVIAFGLAASGLLYRVVMKIVAVRRRKIIVEHLKSDWIDDRNQDESRGDKWQHRRSLNERDELIDDLRPLRRDSRQQPRPPDKPYELIDDLHRSLMSGASDDRARQSFQADGELPNNARRTSGSVLIADKVRERESMLEQLRRDLDRLLQVPKGA